MSTEILQETRTRMYKHANRPVPLQNIRLNFTENPYHRVIRGNTYNLRTTSSGLVRLNTHLSTPQHIQRQHLYFPPVHQSQTTQQQQQPAPIRHTPKKQSVRNLRRARIATGPGDDSEPFIPFNRKSLQVQTDETDIIQLRPDVDVEVQTESIEEASSQSLGSRDRRGQASHYREILPLPGVDKSTQVFPEDPEIFVFDKDVQEILEKLVGSTLVQCMGEVLEEEEINSITRQNKHHKVKTRVLLNDR